MKIFIRIIILSAIILNFVFAKKINLLYTANINATYKNCDCGSNPLGGIDRLKTYIDDFQSQNKNTLLVDGGNFFNSYSFLELNKKALESLSILDFDLFTPGVHIFQEKKQLYDQYKKKYYNRIICSNSNLNLINYKDFNISNTKIRFFGFISPEMFKHSKKPDWLFLNNYLKNIEYINDGINIIIYNGYLEDAQKFLKMYNDFDILLLSLDQQTGTWKTGNTIIIGGGHDAESIALVEISIYKNSPEFKVNYIDMNNSIKSDASIMKLFDGIEISNNKEKKDL